MFFHTKELQYPVRVDRPDPVYAKQLQELIGGKFGEMTVMMQYLLQGWSVRGDAGDPELARLKDMLLDTGTEEIAHVEMLSTCVALLLEGTSPEQQEEAAKGNALVYATLGGMNPQHMIMAGLSAQVTDSVGNPWLGTFATASGNLVADLHANATAEMQGRLQACRLYEMTADAGVRDMLSFLIARDHMHQLQWLAAIEELGGLPQNLPVPATFPLERERQDAAFSFLDYSKGPDGHASGQGRWASGPTLDGRGEFSYVADPPALGQAPHLAPPPATLHAGYLGSPTSSEPSASESPADQSIVGKITGALGGDADTAGASHQG